MGKRHRRALLHAQIPFLSRAILERSPPVNRAFFAHEKALAEPALTIGAWAMVAGNPARLRDWVCRCGQQLALDPAGAARYACGLACRKTAENQIEPL
jgi:hypothetical protein